MGSFLILILRFVLAGVLAGTLFVQVVMTPLLAADLDEVATGKRVALLAIFVLGLLTIQVAALCFWRLLTMTKRGTVFSHDAFRWVDLVIADAAAACVLTFSLAVVLAPGEGVAPGIVLLICGASLIVAGVALLILVLRALLSQAVALNSEARQLRGELQEVI